MENFHFPFEILLCPFGELERDVQIYNNHDRTSHGIFPFLIQNTYILAFKIYKGFSSIYNDRDKAYHGISIFNLTYLYFKIFITFMISNCYLESLH